MMVMLATLVPSGRPARYVTALATSSTGKPGSTLRLPSAWTLGLSTLPSEVTALPMSICEQAIEKGRPSSWVHFVRPEMACLEMV